MNELGLLDLLTVFGLLATGVMGALSLLWLADLAARWLGARPALPLWHQRLRQEWGLSLLKDKVLRWELERRDRKQAELARTHFHEKKNPEAALQSLLFNPVGMLKRRPLPDLLRQAKEKAYLKKVLKDLP